MKPYPESFVSPASLAAFPDPGGARVWTFLNLCFVNIKSVGTGGEILSLSVNSPGSEYPRGSRVFLIDGEGGDVSQAVTGTTPFQWIPGLGSGATAIVSQSGQVLGIGGGEDSGLASIPSPGSLLYLPDYGHGLESTEQTLFNTAPNLGKFIVNYSGLETVPSNLGFFVINADIPRDIQNCIATNTGTSNAQDTSQLATTYPETGTRKIVHSWRSINNHALIDRNVTNLGGLNYFRYQYAAPGQYLGGFWEVPLAPPIISVAQEGKNSFLWLALDQGFDSANFRGKFALARDTFVLPDFTWGDGTGSFTPLVPGGAPIVGPFTNVQWADHRPNAMGPKIAPVLGEGSVLLPYSLTGNSLELLSFSRDNETPLNYTGSTVSQNQMVCYEIELISLILPNKPLDNTIGGLIAFYPYLYVELTNATAPSGGTPGIIYSNNPNAHKALFRVAIDDTPTPVISKFIKVDGDGAVQTVKFKPNDNLHFRVYLQNGTLFATQEKDTAPPAEPDPFVQISAEFAIRRLT